MTIIQRSAGLAAILLSAFGLTLCLAGAGGVWIGKGRADAIAGALFKATDEGFAFIESRLDRVNQTLDKSRERVSGLSTLAESLKNTQADLIAEFQPVAQRLDEVYNELHSAEQWLDSLEAVAANVNRLSEAIVLSNANATRNERRESARVTAENVAEFSAGVADALARVQVMRQELIDLREDRMLARAFAAAMITHVAELDAKLARVSARIDTFNAHVSPARASSFELGRNVHWWITFATVSLTLVLLWFGVSQIGMMKCGWRLARVSGT